MSGKKLNETLVDVEEVYSKTEKYIEENQKSLSIIVGIIVILVGGYFGYNKFYIEPQAEEAMQYMWKAQQYFEQDSFRLALKGDGMNFGFEYIADEYSMTKPGNLANYYCGICNMQMGDFNKAIEYLTEFDSDDEMVGPVGVGCLGDCYMELGNTEKALEFYNNAANKKDNEFTAPIYLKKAGLANELLGDYNSAKSAYERIKKDYPNSDQAKDIDKYIAKAEGLLSK